MKLTSIPSDGKKHTCCLQCRRETLRERPPATYTCTTCGFVSRRALIFDPAIKSWLGDDGEYWHQNAAVVVRDAKGRFLFLERATYPSGLTIPIGHVDRGEKPPRAGRRELYEETNLQLPLSSFKRIVLENILGDPCRRGSDAHRWNVFAAPLAPGATVKVNHKESVRAEWLTLDEALQSPLVPVLRSVINRHAAAILRGQP